MTENPNAGKANSKTGAAGAGAAGKIKDMIIQNVLARIKHRILVMSGKGGVGKSSLAANIAFGLARKGYRVGLLDVDLHGPSISNMLGLSGMMDISEDKFIVPKSVGDNLKVVSMQSFMAESDQAVIWRGPIKTGVIRQFVGDVKWGDLDFMVIDTPPGTGDEHLSVVQTIPEVRALIVTTPQEVALSDVRKSISFCRTVEMQIVGLVENMGPFPCPCCGGIISPFKSGGGLKTAQQMNVDFLGTIPFDPEVVKTSDQGLSILEQNASASFSTALNQMLDRLVAKLD